MKVPQLQPNDTELCPGVQVVFLVKRRNQCVQEGKSTRVTKWVIRPKAEVERLSGIMKDSSIQEGSERKERRRGTKLLVERKYCLRVEAFGSLVFPSMGNRTLVHWNSTRTSCLDRVRGENSL